MVYFQPELPFKEQRHRINRILRRVRKNQRTLNNSVLVLKNLSQNWERVARFQICPEQFPEWSHEHLTVLAQQMSQAPFAQVFQLAREQMQRCVLEFIEIMREIPWPGEHPLPEHEMGMLP